MSNNGCREPAELEAILLGQLRQRGPGWVTSRELASEVGFPFQGVAHTLLRLAGAKVVQVQEITWRSNRSRPRTCYVYRLVEVRAVYPAWLMPQAPEIKVGAGRVFRCKGE